jgi:CRP/FNR family cyclic AMP-dependent transcriptional regulator
MPAKFRLRAFFIQENLKSRSREGLTWIIVWGSLYCFIVERVYCHKTGWKKGGVVQNITVRPEDRVVEEFGRVPLFSDLPKQELVDIRQAALIKSCRRNRFLVVEGDFTEHLYIVLAGKVKASILSPANGRETLLAIYSTGDFFGEVSLMDGGASPVNFSVMEDCRLALISRDVFTRLIANDNGILRRILQVYCSQFRNSWEKIRELTCDKVENRLQNALLRLARKHGIQDSRGIIINLKISHRELAEMIGATRESVSRRLSQLKKSGVLNQERYRLVILKPKDLASANRLCAA